MIHEKYYELNKMNRDLQSAIDETDNINIKKALMKMQEEINKEKADYKKNAMVVILCKYRV